MCANLLAPNVPTEDDIGRLADLSIDENYDPKMETPAVTEKGIKRGGQMSSRLMLLKAFASQSVSGNLRNRVESNAKSERAGSKGCVLTDLQANKTYTAPSEAVDLYFLQHDGKSRRGKTSGRTLASLYTGGDTDLRHPATLERLLADYKPIQTSVSREIQLDLSKRLFPRWWIYLRAGFNILLYGIGSKQRLIDEFRKQYLSHANCLEVAAYDASVKLRPILTAICQDLLQLPDQLRKTAEQLTAIKRLMSRPEASNCPVYLLIHNIDAPGLRNTTAQSVLAHLAGTPNIHVIASLDNQNTPLLWSWFELSLFTWIWEDCTSLTSYSREVGYQHSPVLQQLLTGVAGGMSDQQQGLYGRTAVALASLRQVMASLTQNARDVFRILVEHRAHQELADTPSTLEDEETGMPLEDLYWRCRDAFLVNSETTLRAQLTEFRDHKLIRIRKSPDGTERVQVLMDDESVAKFLSYFQSFC